MKRLLPMALLGLLATTGCNESTEGAEGNIIFTPMNCGRLGCSFDDSIGVGGAVEIGIEGTDGVSTAGVVLESDDPSVLTVSSIPDIGGRPAWLVEGTGAGVARLQAYDIDDVQIDFLEVGVQELTGLGMEVVLGSAPAPSFDDPEYDEVWTVPADQAVSLQVTPYIGERAPTMGVYVYTATVDEALEESLLDSDLSGGYLYFQVPAGEYTASFEDDYGHFIDLLIVAEAP